MFMKKFTSRLLALALVAAALGSVVAATFGSRRAATAGAASDELVALLPASDVIAVVDLSRVFSEVIPQIKALTKDGGAKMTKEIEEFVADTGIDPAKVTSAAVGFKLTGADPSKGSLAAIFQGVTLDRARIEASVKADQGTMNTVEYKGAQLLVITPPRKAEKAAAPGEKKAEGDAGAPADKLAAVQGEEIALVQLDANRAAVGSLGGVKAVLDARAAPAAAANAKLTELLKQTPNGLVRYAASVPPDAAQALAGQGELFAQLATIKMVFGTLNLGQDLSATLDTKMRTATRDEATQLETSLAGLVSLGKMFIGGNQKPEMQAVAQLLDLVKIGSEATDVSLSLAVPRAVFDAFAKSAKPEAAKDSAPKKQ
jgi:hypothetical protein